MRHLYQLLWQDYFPNVFYFQFCRNKEGIVRSSGQYFIYHVSFDDIHDRSSIKISSQSTSTRVLVHTCIFNNCTSNESVYHFSQYGNIIFSKIYFKLCSSLYSNQKGQSISIHSSECNIFSSSFCLCKGTGSYSPVLDINSHSTIKSINETKNECQDVTAFTISIESNIKYSLVNSNAATRYRILYWTSGNHIYSENMIINNSEKMQAIAFVESLVNVTISKCSFVNNKGKSLFYAYLYQSLTSSMTIEECSMISNEVSETFKSDPGMILNNENAGHLSFQVFVHVLSNFETLPPFQDYIISCRLMHQTHFHFYLLFPLIIL